MSNTLRVTLVAALLAAFVPTTSARAHPRHCEGHVHHVRIAPGVDASTEMIVSFASLPGVHEAPTGGVLIGTTPSKMDTAFVETEPATTYSVQTSPSRANNGDDTYTSPYYHHVTITGLKPYTTYFYKPVIHSNLRGFSKYDKVKAADGFVQTRDGTEERIEDTVEIASEGSTRWLRSLPPYDGNQKKCPDPDRIRTFRTAPASATPGDESTVQPVSFAVMGDLGQFAHSAETLSRMIRSRHEIDALILAGDLAYPRLDHMQWDTFLDFLDDYPIADHKPMAIVPGNHDIDKQGNGKDIFLAYENRFRMPRFRPPQLGVFDGPDGPLDMDVPPYPLPYEFGNAYYAYTYGPVRMIMLNAYSSMEPKSPQYNWIVDELNSVDRSTTPWVNVVIHVPLYNSFVLHRHDVQIAQARKHLEPLFVEHSVNMVFTGHIHAYQRTNKVAFGDVNPRGPMYVTVGAGGRKCEAPFLNKEPEPWVAVRDATWFGYGMFRVMNATHAEWEWVHSGHNDDRMVNQLGHSEETLPAGPDTDKLVVRNNYFS